MVGPRSSRPNFLILMTDQQRADHLGCYGNTVLRTPHIDSLARNGALFERFYTNSPVCMPNRAALATGRMPSAAGVRMNGVPLPLSAVTYADLLREAGYRTALIGKAHFQTMTEAPPMSTGGEPGVPRSHQADRDDRSDAAFSSESPRCWQEPRFEPARPYYGFEEAELCLEHGDAVGGAYERWLEEKDPEAAWNRRGSAGALPGEQAAPQAWRTAIPEHLYPTRFIAERTMDWLSAHAAGPDRERPFLLQCSFPDPHHPFTPPGRYWSLYRPDEVALPRSFGAPLAAAPPHKLAVHREFAEGRRRTTGSRVIAVSAAEARQAIALNFGAIAMIDDAVGEILEVLAASGLDDDTVVVFLSDHGDFMGDHGLLFKGPLHYQSVVRMPFLWRDTKEARRAERISAPACAMDLAPTLLARAGIDAPHGTQGRSLLRLLAGQVQSGDLNRAILIEEQCHRDVPGLPPPWRVRTLIAGDRRLSIFAGADWGELYDLGEDPDELHNRFADPAWLVEKSDMLWRLASEMTELSQNLPLPTHMA